MVIGRTFYVPKHSFGNNHTWKQTEGFQQGQAISAGTHGKLSAGFDAFIDEGLDGLSGFWTTAKRCHLLQCRIVDLLLPRHLMRCRSTPSTPFVMDTTLMHSDIVPRSSGLAVTIGKEEL